MCDRKDSIYYSFRMRGNSPWRIVVLDPYEESVMTGGGGRVGHELTLENGGLSAEFTKKCQDHNPNDILRGSNYFAGLHGVESRWSPFNGGIGKSQLVWLEKVLQEADKAGEKVILLSHVILHPDATPGKNSHTLLWDYEAVLPLIEEFHCVKLVLAGHAHQQAYHFCPLTGVHHVSLASPLEAPDGLAEDTFAVLEIADDDETGVLIGSGLIPTIPMRFRPSRTT